MRIECDNCGAKYSIADEKVIGKMFKVRCKKCSNMIMVDGTAMAPPDDVEEATRVFDTNAAQADAEQTMSEDDAVWYVVIDGAQTGPLTIDEIVAQVQLGSIGSGSFAWREGMDDWETLVDIPEFSGFIDGALPAGGADEPEDAYEDEATRVAESPIAESGFSFGSLTSGQSSIETFQSGSYASVPAPKPARSAPVTGSGSGTSDFFSSAAASAPSPVAKPAASSSDPASVGQRNENSVLFSLKDLTSGSKSSAPKDDLPRTEGSGLIDIRVLASSQSSVGSSDSPISGGGGPMGGTQALPVTPIIPIAARRSNAGLYIGITIGVIVILSLGGALVYLLTRPDPPTELPADLLAAAAAQNQTATADDAPPEGQTPAGDAQATAETGGDAPGEETAQAESTDEATDTPESDETAEAEAEGEGGDEAGDSDEETRVAAANTARTERAPETRRTEETRDEPPARRDRDPDPPREERVAAAPATSDSGPPGRDRDRSRSGGDDAVQSALDAITGTPPRTERASEPPATTRSQPASEEPDQLSRAQVQGTIRRYGSRISGCKRSEDQSGTYRVRFVIQPGGNVTNVASETSGDVQQCIVGVVRDMSFPRFGGDPIPVTFPFNL